MTELLSTKKTLAELISVINDAEVQGDTSITITGITLDSRKVAPGDIYVCIPGLSMDGHDFAESAIKAGARALVVQRYLPIDIPQLKVTDTRQVVGYLAARLYDNPSHQLSLVGVTGTNGKTTVTHLIEKIARHKEQKTGIIGTLGAKIGDKELPGQHTTPESTDIQKLLREMVLEDVEMAVMEVSSHALDLGRVNGCVFRAAIFTNLSQDHLDYHKNMDDYLNAKGLLFSGIDKEDKNKFAVINADDPASDYLKRITPCSVFTYGVDAEADFKAQNIQLTDQGVEFEVKFKEKIAKVFYRTPGKFSVYNALAAFTWGIMSGYSLDVVIKALETIRGVPGRFESVRAGQPFLVIVDYAHTPDGLENVLSTAREFTSGKLYTVFGCGGDRDKKKRPLMGEAASRWSDYLIVTSDNPRTEEPHSIIEDILPGIKGVEYAVIEDRRSAILRACDIATSGDTIVIAGKGHEDYQIIGKNTIHFDDREEVREALRGIGYVEK